MSSRRRPRANRPTDQPAGRPGLLHRVGRAAPIRVELLRETATHLIIRWLQKGLAHDRGTVTRVRKSEARFAPDQE